MFSWIIVSYDLTFKTTMLSYCIIIFWKNRKGHFKIWICNFSWKVEKFKWLNTRKQYHKWMKYSVTTTPFLGIQRKRWETEDSSATSWLWPFKEAVASEESQKMNLVYCSTSPLKHPRPQVHQAPTLAVFKRALKTWLLGSSGWLDVCDYFNSCFS